MKTVWQDNKYGCGAACLAMLAGISYRKAKKRLFGNNKPDYIRTEFVLAALSEFGFQPGAKGRLSKANPVSKLKILPGTGRWQRGALTEGPMGL